MTWKTLSTRTVYENRWIRVREDEVIHPDGARGIYGVVATQHPAVFVVAVDDADQVALVQVERYPQGRLSWEVPAGSSDGEDAVVAARRELLEETGMRADTWTRIGTMAALNGVADAPEVVFLATGLQVSGDPARSQEEEGIRELRWVPFTEVIAMIGDGRLTDGESITALAFAAIARGRMA